MGRGGRGKQKQEQQAGQTIHSSCGRWRQRPGAYTSKEGVQGVLARSELGHSSRVRTSWAERAGRTGCTQLAGTAASGVRHMGHFWCRHSQLSQHLVWNTCEHACRKA